MGMRGPIPDREDNLARSRDRKGSDEQSTKRGQLREVLDVPAPDEDWHPIAKQVYLSLAASGQSDFFQESDWAFAYSVCEDLSHYKSMERRNGQILTTIYSALGSLLVTEGDRRRVRVELEAPQEPEKEATVVALELYSSALEDLDEEEE